jgi:hypothetical protein
MVIGGQLGRGGRHWLLIRLLRLGLQRGVLGRLPSDCQLILDENGMWQLTCTRRSRSPLRRLETGIPVDLATLPSAESPVDQEIGY